VIAATGAGAAAATTSMAAPQAAAAASRGHSKEQLFTFDNTAVVFIDYQPEMLDWVTSTDTRRMMVRARALARLAVRMEMPVVLSTISVEMGVNQPTIPELRAEIPDVPEIDRTTMNSWDDPAFRQAIRKTGRRNLIMLGLWTEICLAFPVAEMQAAGLRTTFATDAVGGVTKEAHDQAIQRMIQAGSVPSSAFALIAEAGLDWASPQGQIMREVGGWMLEELEKLD
ncbi:isochorismatase family protein, partial [Phytoactinopolyspora endophytica]|uniref:isochorismatase family protein n=1 Tax=Phytoactinopolyspora endophytica TaxID=1642495 RepID=UPI00197BEF8C